VGRGHVNPKNFIGSLCVFYLLPVFLIYFTPYIPIIGILMALIISTFYLEEGYLYTFSPLLGWMFGMVTCNSKLTFMCIVRIFVYWIATSFFPLITIPWWMFIYFALWIYTKFILLLSPLLYKDGFEKVCEQIANHQMGLTILFMLLTLKSSVQFLIQQVTTGFTICMLYILYKLYKNRNSNIIKTMLNKKA